LTKQYTKNKEWAIQTPLNTGGQLGAPEGETVPAPLAAPVVLLFITSGDKYRKRKWEDGIVMIIEVLTSI
jgi:hypothetical protein